MKTIVVVDDEKDIVTIVSELLETVDAKVLGVGYDGKSAIELVQTHNPDLLFLDLMMPENDGFYAIEQIKKFNKKTRIITITGDIREETLDKLHSFGITDIIHKPVDFDQLLKIASSP